MTLVQIEGQHLHAQRIGQLAHTLPDASETDNPQLFVDQFHQRRLPEAEIFLSLPLAFTHQLVVQGAVVSEVKHDCQNMLCYAIGSIFRHIRDGNSARRGRLYIDDVIAGGRDGNELQVRVAAAASRRLVAPCW